MVVTINIWRMVFILFMVAVVKCVKHLNIYMMENQY